MQDAYNLPRPIFPRFPPLAARLFGGIQTMPPPVKRGLENQTPVLDNTVGIYGSVRARELPKRMYCDVILSLPSELCGELPFLGLADVPR